MINHVLKRKLPNQGRSSRVLRPPLALHAGAHAGVQLSGAGLTTAPAAPRPSLRRCRVGCATRAAHRRPPFT
eukprot:6679793-Prymnesium_polylepis.2